jgi:hypothetical protein
VVLRPEAGVQALRVTSPEDKVTNLERGNRPDFVYMGAEHVGVYTVKIEGSAKKTEKKEEDEEQAKSANLRQFAVNLLDANESNIEPRDEIRIGNERITAGQDRPQPRDLWKIILLLAVVLLMVEWYIYNKRVSL